jgi:hypothetical protein
MLCSSAFSSHGMRRLFQAVSTKSATRSTSCGCVAQARRVTVLVSSHTPASRARPIVNLETLRFDSGRPVQSNVIQRYAQPVARVSVMPYDNPAASAAGQALSPEHFVRDDSYYWWRRSGAVRSLLEHDTSRASHKLEASMSYIQSCIAFSAHILASRDPILSPIQSIL